MQELPAEDRGPSRPAPGFRRPRPRFKDCNVVVTTQEGTQRQVQRTLAGLGEVRSSGYRGVILLKVDDRRRFLEELKAQLEADATFAASLSHAVPAEVHATFATREQLEDRLHEALLSWLPRIAGRRFYVRFRRRGYQLRLSSHEEERRLADVLFEGLAAGGQSAEVDFHDPDEVIYVETVGSWVGASAWSREERERYPFVRVS